MAITVSIPTNGEGSSGTDATSYNTASFTPVANRLYLLTVNNGLVGTPATPTVTGCGLTWVQVNTTTRNNCRVTVFRAMGASPSTGTLTISFAATQSNCLWQLTEWQGIDTTGTSGSGAVIQNNAANQAGTNASVTLANAIGSGNATFGAVFVNSSSDTATPATGYTELGTTATSTSPSIRRSTEWAVAGTLTIAMTIGGTTNNWGIIGLEIKAASGTIAITNVTSISSAEAFSRPTVTIAGTVLPITFRSAATAAGDHVNTLTVNAPAGLQLGDFMLAVVGMSADLTVTSVPADWRFIRTDASATTGNEGYRQSAYWKVAVAADIPTASVTPQFVWGFNAQTGDCVVAIAAYSGVNPDTPFDGDPVGQADDGVTSTTIDSPTQTSTATNDYLVVASGANPLVTAGGWGTPVIQADGFPNVGECSGLAASSSGGGGVWAIQDSGNNPSIWWCKETSRGNFTTREIPVTGATNGDWEDIYFDGTHLWIHDNRATGNPHRLYKVTEPSNPNTDTSATIVATYHWDFPSGEPDANVQGDTQHPHNCEAIAIYGGRLYGILKNNSSAPNGSLVYDFGPTGSLSTNSLSPTTTGTKIGYISADSPSSFAISSDGTLVIVVNHSHMRVYKANSGSGVANLVTGQNTLVFDTTVTGGSMEGATFFPYGTTNLLAGSEDKTAVDVDGSITLARITKPASMTVERANVTVGSGTTQRAVLQLSELSFPSATTSTGIKTATLTDGGRNVGQAFLLLASNRTAPTGSVQFIDFSDKTIISDPGGGSDTETQYGTGINSCMLGWWPAGYTNMTGSTNPYLKGDEEILGKKFAVFRSYSPWESTASDVQKSLDRGMLVLASHKAPKILNSWQKVGDGSLNTRITALAKQYKGYGKDIVFIFHHEPHDQCGTVKSGLQSSDPTASSFNYGTAAEYIQAFRNIITIFRNEGAAHYGPGGTVIGGNVYFGYTAVGNFWGVKEDKGQTAATLFPGADWIDVFTTDDYNEYHAQMWKDNNGTLVKSGNKTNDWKEFQDKWLPNIELCEKYQKPMIIGEFGSDTSKDGYSIDDWFRRMATWIQTNPLAKKWLIGFCYFHSPPPTVNYQFTRGALSPVGVEGWRDAFTEDQNTGANRTYFVSTPRAIVPNSGTSPPPPPSTGGGTTTTILSRSIPSLEAFGRPQVTFTSGPKYINVTESIPSEEAFGYPTVRLAGTQYISFATKGGILSAETFGRPTVYTADKVGTAGLPTNSRPHALIAIRSASTRIVREALIYESDGITPWLDREAYILDGSVNISADRDERRTLDITFDNTDGALNSHPGGFWYDKIIKVSRGVDYGASSPYMYQLGEFMIDSIESQNFPHSIHVTGRDYTKKLMQAKFQFETRFPKGQTIDQIVDSVATGFNGGIRADRLNLDRTPAGTPGYPPVNALAEQISFARGDSRWEQLKKLTTIFGYDLYFDRLGFLTMTLFVDPMKDPTFTFEIGENSNLVSYTRHTNDSNLFNVLVVVGGSASHDFTSANDPLAPFGKAANEVPGSPTSVQAIGERTYQLTDSRLSTDAMCEDLAKRLLPVYCLDEFQIQFESLVVPWLDVNEVVYFENPDNPTDPPYYLLREINIPLALGPMTSTAKRITKVI